MRKFHRKKLRNRISGSISSFMCIAVAVIILFNTLLVDCARLLVLDELVERRTYFCADSLAADYMAELRDSYGLYGLYLRDSEIRRNSAYDFLSSENIDISGLLTSFAYKDYDDLALFDYEIKNLQLKYMGCITEPEVIKENIYELMKYKAPANLVEKLVGKIDMFEESSDLCEVQSLLSQATGMKNKAVAGMDEIKIAIEGTDSSQTCSVCEWEKVGEKIVNMQTELIDSLIPGLGAENADAQKLIDSFKLLSDTLKKYKEYNTVAIEKINEMVRMCNELKLKIAEIEDHMADFDFEIKQNLEYYRSIKPKLDELRSFLSNASYSAVLVKLKKNVTLLNNAESASNSAVTYLVNGNREKESPKEWLEIVKKVSDISCDLRVPDPAEFNGDSDYKDYDMSATKDAYVDNVFSGEVDIVIPDKKLKCLPSVEHNAEGEIDLSAVFDAFDKLDIDNADISDCEDVSGIADGFVKALDTAAENLCINEYIMSFFYCDGDSIPENRVFNAEIEYIISGNAKQSDNTEDVYAGIMALRTVMNFVHILLDSSKVDFANKIGNSIAAATFGIGGPLYAFIIMGTWAVAEAAIDVIDLKEGESVPFYKKKGDWKLDIGLDYIGSAYLDKLTDNQTSALVTEKDSIMNMSYRDYLNLLLLCVPKTTKLLRICDLIELNLSEIITEDFNFSEVYTSVSCDLTILVDPVVDIGFIKKGKKGGKYELRFIGNSVY